MQKDLIVEQMKGCGSAGSPLTYAAGKDEVKQLVFYLKKQPPGRLIVMGFALVILVGTGLLLLPISVRPDAEVRFIDALFTSTSAVCVTGLIAIDVADHFTAFGQTIVAALIQIGGLGVTSIGVGLILAAGKKVSFKGRTLVKEALNVDGLRGMVRLVKAVLAMTLCFELVGMALSFIVFVQDYPPLKALGISAFHSIAAFNNSGFDILGGLRNLIPYQSDVLLNLTTCGLIIFGGLGFLVIIDIIKKRSFKKLMLHSKIVIITTLVLILSGTLLLKLTEDVTWLGAFFQSVTARTAGFSTYPIGEFTNAGLFTLIILMFIGASPGSTGGGIKTSTFFVLMQQVRSLFTKKHVGAFRRSISPKTISKASIIAMISLLLVCVGTFFLCILEPEYSFVQLLFEEVSAFGTVGLSTGITPYIGDMSKLILIFTMFAGRVGMFTLLSIWIDRPTPMAHYTEESVVVG